jgi:hypothetical protein
VGTYNFTHSATHTGGVIELQGGDAGKVSKIFHKLQTLLPVIDNVNADASDDQL